MKHPDWQRRHLLAAAAATAAGTILPAQASDSPIQWKMVTTWPKNFPALGTGAERLAKIIGEMSGNRLRIKVFGAQELVGPFEVFDAVSRGTAQMGHGASYYWKGKHPATQFFSTVPFGLTAQEMNAWIYHGGGQALWTKLYQPFGLLPFPCGNTGVQMGGWFNKEINSLEDIKGLKMRIPGLGGEILQRAGGTPVNLPGGEIFTSLQSGAIDATEWVGPYNDMAFGLHKAAKFYYSPGWHEPGTSLEAIVNLQAFNELPRDLQAIVAHATRSANLDMLAELTVKNPQALETLRKEHKIQIKKFPDEVLKKFAAIAEEVLAEIAAFDPLSREIYDSFRQFRQQVTPWHAISELAILQTRHP